MASEDTVEYVDSQTVLTGGSIKSEGILCELGVFTKNQLSLTGE